MLAGFEWIIYFILNNRKEYLSVVHVNNNMGELGGGKKSTIILHVYHDADYTIQTCNDYKCMSLVK